MIDLEKKFEEYLKLVGLDLEKMGKTQLVETRRAFYGGLGACFNVMAYEMVGMSENDSIKALDGIKNGINNFWMKENEEAGKRLREIKK